MAMRFLLQANAGNVFFTIRSRKAPAHLAKCTGKEGQSTTLALADYLCTAVFGT
jgi:hypothetical protein